MIGVKNYLKRLKKELSFFLPIGFIGGIIISYFYLFPNPILYFTAAQITFSDIGQKVFEDMGFADEPEKIFRHEKLQFLSQTQKQNIELNISADYKSLSISVKDNNPFKAPRIANSIAESYKTELDKAYSAFAEKRYKEKVEKIDKLYNGYKEGLDKVNEQLIELEPRVVTLQEQQESTESLRRSLRERIDKLELRKSELLRIYTESHPEVVGINLELATLKDKIESLAVIKGVENLQRDVLQKRTRYNELLGKIAELEKQKEFLREAEKEPAATISQYATRPTKPIGDVSAGDVYKRTLLSGLLLGFVASLLVAAISDTIVSEFEISNIPELPLIATVPFVKPKKRHKIKQPHPAWKRIAMHLLFSYDDSTEYVNAYRSLAAHIRMGVFKDDIDKKVIVFTSPENKAGKSTVSANLAIILVQLSKNTVILDGNLNRRSVAKFFGIGARELGISDILSGKAKLEDCLKDVTDILLAGIDWDVAMKTYGLDRLKILPSGTKVPDPAVLLESEAVAGLFKQLREQFDCIIVDSPSLLRSPDSIILSRDADAVFLVSKTGSTSYRDLIKCGRELTKVNIQIKGNILVCT